MNVRWYTLAQRIRLEMQELDQILATVQHHWERFLTAATDQDAFLNSVALNLHSFYNGLERIMELVALEVDGGALGGDAWHTELLRQMTLGLPQVRPALLSMEVSRQLDEYRKFRHVVRHTYTTQLDDLRLKPLVENLPALWAVAREQFLAFAAFLEQLESAADKDD